MAISDSKIREQVVGRIVDCGAVPLAINANDVVILDNNTIDVGAIFYFLPASLRTLKSVNISTAIVIAMERTTA